VSTKVKVLNELRNKSRFMRRKHAAHYVKIGRAARIGPGQIQLIPFHPNHIVAAHQAGGWEASYQPRPDDLDRVIRSIHKRSHLPLPLIVFYSIHRC
jgi:ABC-type taurine transport system substrate-binding protein